MVSTLASPKTLESSAHGKPLGRQPSIPSKAHGEPSARAVRDEWLEWLRLSAFSPLTVKGYRLTSDKLLERWPSCRCRSSRTSTSSG
jgi:hypothetical protein